MTTSFRSRSLCEHAPVVSCLCRGVCREASELILDGRLERVASIASRGPDPGKWDVRQHTARDEQPGAKATGCRPTAFQTQLRGPSQTCLPIRGGVEHYRLRSPFESCRLMRSHLSTCQYSGRHVFEFSFIFHFAVLFSLGRICGVYPK